MTKRQMIQVELENLNDEDLAEVLGVVKKLAAKKHATGTKLGLLAKLKQVKIEGPEDFAANLDGAQPERLGDLCLKIFGSASGADLELPPRESQDPPDLD